jgi:hypothetical protein
VSAPARIRSPQPVENSNGAESRRTASTRESELLKAPAKNVERGRSKSAKAIEFLRRSNCAVFGVAMVIVNAPEAVPGGMLPGLKEAVARSGSPDAERVTGLERVPWVLTTKEKLAELPETIVWVVALLEAKVKSAGPDCGAVTVNSVEGELLDRKFVSPEYAAVTL